MKKLLPILVVLTLLLTPTLVLAQSAKSVYVEYPYMGGNSVYLDPNPSGLVQGWQWDHPRDGDTHIVYKPYDKFPNATTCDEGYVFMNDSWTARPLYNNAYDDYKDVVEEVFPDLDQEYLLCKYPLD